jgi:hypothetical protein
MLPSLGCSFNVLEQLRYTDALPLWQRISALLDEKKRLTAQILGFKAATAEQFEAAFRAASPLPQGGECAGGESAAAAHCL